MTTHSLIDELSGDPDVQRAEAALFLRKLKTAGVVDTLKAPVQQTIKFVKSHPHEVAGALLGGAALGLAQYKANKVDRSGSSFEQRTTALAQEMHRRSVQEQKARGGKPGFVSDLSGAMTNSARNIADVLAKHPGQGALLAVPLGASLGAKLLPKIMK